MRSQVFTEGIIERNPAWVQLLGLCPLLAVSSSIVTAAGLAAATAFVLCGSNTLIALLRRAIPDFARLPLFVLVIATFTTIAVMVLEAYAFELYQRIALFVQIIVTNCMILGRAETFASRQPVGAALLDALGTAAGFALALIGLGAVRELVGQGTLLAGTPWVVEIASADYTLLIARLPPGAFIVAGLLVAAANWIGSKRRTREQRQTG